MAINNEEIFLKAIGEKIKLARKSASVSQGELAENIGTTQQLISLYEKGTRPIRINTLNEIAMVCGVSINYFFLDSSEVNEALDIVTYWPPELQTMLIEQVRATDKAREHFLKS